MPIGPASHTPKPPPSIPTHTYALPAPGADGKQPAPQYQRTQRFAPENYQTTSVVDTELWDEMNFSQQAEFMHPST